MLLLWLVLPVAALGIYYGAQKSAGRNDDSLVEFVDVTSGNLAESFSAAGNSVLESFETVKQKTAAYGATLGIRNNNPGNIRASAIPWQGKAGSNGGFEVFDDAVNGIRALARNLLAYQRQYGMTTIEQIINRWAPTSENNTAAYVASVSQQTGIAPRAAVNLSDAATLTAITRAIIRHENGAQPYDDATIQTAINKALA
jgi:hypothetical protein